MSEPKMYLGNYKEATDVAFQWNWVIDRPRYRAIFNEDGVYGWKIARYGDGIQVIDYLTEEEAKEALEHIVL